MTSYIAPSKVALSPSDLVNTPLSNTSIKTVQDHRVLPPIYFYIPQDQLPFTEVPDDIDANWQMFAPGVFAWTLQTYIRLKQDGFPCEFTGSLPDEGIIVMHRDSVPQKWKPSHKQLFVCIQADRTQHPWAHFHVVHNPQGVLPDGKFEIRNSYYIPHWAPQPGLIPRDPARGDRFENIAFFGHERNLAPELKHPAWEAALTEMGLTWHVIDRDHWNDYSQVDAVVAVRSFNQQDFTIKPALKLYNAWHAGVPAILGCESAFRAERISPIDYLEATSAEETLSLLRILVENPDLRQAMVQNGKVRSRETNPTIHLKMWRDLILGTAVPAYENWRRASSWQRNKFYTRHSVKQNVERIKRRSAELYGLFRPPVPEATPMQSPAYLNSVPTNA
ncbi:hypothetical protein H6G89_11130 [Oscillatoria sp. FACHB-1407]|uniref:glycosyltransferase n=1 Tax=Oscillatoria sp. FACHB-1407 TaxID=2692847 RepID=UPI0016831F21|nr:glycosyltransferase [Oscillatoria sp. FACHB-1407]MBD2461603.1 hypothetical protein [Oscillatoria sp. FACHB-1407]